MDSLHRFGPLVGRILIALIFVMSGLGKITGFDATVGYIASKGLPLATLGALAAIVVEFGGGLLLIIGWQARLAAAAMLVFTAMTALFFHNFWAVPPDQVQNTMIHFMKNISMMGGLLYVVVHGAGALSLDARRRA
jgi:putative oxidoreductase